MATDSDSELMFGETMKSMLQDKSGPNTHDASSTDVESESDFSDLKLWLQHTGFFDLEHRQKVLSALRKLKVIDEQRWKLISEIQTTTPYIVPPSTPAMPQSPTAFSAYSPSLVPTRKPNQSTLDRLTDYNSLSGLHVTATPGSGDLCSSEPSLVNRGGDSDCAYSAFGNGSLSSQQHDVPIHSSSVKHAQQTVDDPDSESQEDEWSQGPKRSIETEAIHCDKTWRMDGDAQTLTLAPKPEARYFLIKSFNTMNVEMSQRDGLWITKAKNGPMLTFAFNQCKNVYLIFSVNKSKAFQGYARMTTAPSPEIAPAKWMNNISWEASSPFRVEWLNTRRTEFWNLGDLKNSFNDEAPVFVGRDGQEYPESCGRNIIEIMDRTTGERSGTPLWPTREAYNDTKLANPHSHSKSGKKEALNWRREELSDADEAVLAHAASEPVDDMPLIEY
ncbi:hypothetical protein ACHAQJ_001763 [Trichoderma viride]